MPSFSVGAATKTSHFPTLFISDYFGTGSWRVRRASLGHWASGGPAVEHLVEKEEAKPQMSLVPSQCMMASIRFLSFGYVLSDLEVSKNLSKR